jgi:hypothetical protein
MAASFSQAETDSIHHRHAQSPVIPHRRVSVASIVQPDPLKVVLPTDEITLKRHLGLFSGVCFIIGSIIGNLSILIFSSPHLIIACYY